MKALGVDTEDDIYLLSNYFLGHGEGEQAPEGSERGTKDDEMTEEKATIEETAGKMDEREKEDEDGSVVLSVDEKASDSSSVKAHLSGKTYMDFLLYQGLIGLHSSPYCSPYIFQDANKEHLFNNQELLLVLVDHFLHSHNPSVWFRGGIVR